MKKLNLLMTLIVLLVTVRAAPVFADVHPGLAYTLEALGGYGGGVVLGVAGIPLGNLLLTSEDYAGGGLIGFTVFYPVGCGLAVYGTGEAAAGDAPNDKAAVGASIGAASAVMLTGYLTAGWKGVIIGLLIAPVASTVAYNFARGSNDEYKPHYYYISYGFAL